MAGAITGFIATTILVAAVFAMGSNQTLAAPQEKPVAGDLYRGFRAPKLVTIRGLKVAGLTGFVEASTLSHDGKTMYYHKKEDGRHVIYCMKR